MTKNFKMVAKTLYGLEEILAQELRQLGASNIEIGVRNAVPVTIACACAGIIIGSIFSSGLGLKFTNSVIDLSGGREPPSKRVKQKIEASDVCREGV